MSNDFARKRIKNQLVLEKNMADALENLTEEQLNRFYQFLNITYQELAPIADKALEGHITKYDSRIAELDDEIHNASLAVSEAVKKKISFIKEAFNTLLMDL